MIFRENRILAYAAMVWLTAILGALPECHAQVSEGFHAFTLGVGAGIAPVEGQDRKSLDRAFDIQVGGGYAWSRKSEFNNAGDPILPRWFFLLKGNFNFDQSDIKSSALQQAILLNPQNTSLLSATSGKAKFYFTTLDPTVRIAMAGHFSAYFLGGFGWLRRTIEFTGVSSQGGLLQPNGPAVFGPSGNSGVVDAGAGIDRGLKRDGGGFKIYIEARVIHGLANNSGTTLIPLSAGVRW